MKVLLKNIKTIKSQRKNASFRNSLGFTIVELLIAISLIGIISGVTLSVINPAESRTKAEDAVRLANLNRVVTAIDAYHASEGTYPLDNDGDGNPLNTGSGNEDDLANFLVTWPTESDLYYDAGFRNNEPRLCISAPNNSSARSGDDNHFKYIINPSDLSSVQDLSCLGQVLHDCHRSCETSDSVANCAKLDATYSASNNCGVPENSGLAPVEPPPTKIKGAPTSYEL